MTNSQRYLYLRINGEDIVVFLFLSLLHQLAISLLFVLRPRFKNHQIANKKCNFFNRGLLEVPGTVPLNEDLPISHILPISLNADDEMNNIKYIIQILGKKII